MLKVNTENREEGGIPCILPLGPPPDKKSVKLNGRTKIHGSFLLKTNEIRSIDSVVVL